MHGSIIGAIKVWRSRIDIKKEVETTNKDAAIVAIVVFVIFILYGLSPWLALLCLALFAAFGMIAEFIINKLHR